ncbi:MAG: Aspartokinase [Cirrosporium novae-zelandiae]|nr:MAG: Aspartokinase [Cirrosporium novae-zelandiae]
MGVSTLVNGYHNGPQEVSSQLRLNDSQNGWVVQKFGGTSIGKFSTKIAEDVIRTSLSKNRVAVVCSARSSSTKSAGTTNRLLRAASEAEDKKSKQYEKTVDLIAADHLDAAKTNIRSPDIVERLSQEINFECDELKIFLNATQTIGEISPRSLDRVIGVGEKLSCRYMAALLEDHGVASSYVDASEIIDFDTSHGLDQDFYENLAQALARQVQVCGDRVPIITGYFGTVPGSLLDKVGRGYTDFCAALVAVGLHAKELQVWKEVDGIFTADPRKVPTARLLPTITPAEAEELTFWGSEVIHSFTMAQVIRARIPTRIKNVMNPRGNGTVIFPDSQAEISDDKPGHDPRLFMTRSASSISLHQRPKRPTAVTVKSNIFVINVHSNKRSLAQGNLAKIIAVLDKWKFSIDLISTSEVHISMAIHSEKDLLSRRPDGTFIITDSKLKGAYKDLEECGRVDIIPDMAIVSLVGKQMKNMIGIAGKMFSTLGENNVNLEMISQGASEINISCCIESRDADRALNILHTNLFTFLD